MEEKTTKNKSIFKILVYIVDIIVYPIILLSIITSFFMIVSKSKGAVSPIFGYTFVRVLSPSMSTYCEEVGRNFNVNDVALISETNSYQVGDVIAFYSDKDTVSPYDKFDLTHCVATSVPMRDENGNIIKYSNGNDKMVTDNYSPELDENGNIVFESELYNSIINSKRGDVFYVSQYNRMYEKLDPPFDQKTLDQVKKDDPIVKFHQIVQIKIDVSGTVYYVTKGTTAYSQDTILVRQDLVVGEYIQTPKVLSSIVNFCGSALGLILLVIVPISFIILIESLSILEQVNNIVLERKVVSRSTYFDSSECQKANVGLEMDDDAKIYLYDVMPNIYKHEVFDFLWGCLQTSENKKDIQIYQTAKQAIEVYNVKDTTKYYDVWKNSQKSKGFKQKVEQARLRAEQDRFAKVLIEDYQNIKEE